MDRPLDRKTLQKRRLKTGGGWTLAALGLLAAFLLLRDLLSPALAREEIRTAVVERGEVSTSVSASGTVVPKIERVLSSPISSSVVEVYARVGDTVAPDEALLRLDSTQIDREIARLRDELRLNELEIDGTLQDRERQLRDLRSQKEILEIDLRSQEINRERYAMLFETNTVSRFDMEAARLTVEKTLIQLRQLEQQIEGVMKAGENTLAQLEVRQRLLQQELAEQQRLKRETTVAAGVAGIVTALADETGQNVVAGSELARISDLSSFRIDASLSDFYLQQIQPGMEALIRLGNGSAGGSVSRILPAVDNGSIRLQVEFDNPRLEGLKVNLRVEVEILTRRRESGLRVANGIVFNGPGLHDIFVIEEGMAVKRRVEVGLVNSRHVEILAGLEAGEEIIISGMEGYEHLDQVAVTE